MIHADMRGYVGVAPGTTTFTLGKPPLYARMPQHPTQAWLIPQDAYSQQQKIAVPPNQMIPREGAHIPIPAYPTQAYVDWPMVNDRVRMAIPPNQHYVGPQTIKVHVPPVQHTFGPFPNDYMLSKISPYRGGYLPYFKGWISGLDKDGKLVTIFTLAGPEEEKAAKRWGRAAGIVVLLGITATAAAVAIACLAK
ncbi:hypothetical protein LCGC14_0522870 [marine sediment metagenome]|uniref:Uncharacterized protein n=1 Tax=marine sediment metagenome TaxID=412755 RepID=A0A0F9RY31_9ZZZZ